MPYIGIDFGTSNSVVANFQYGHAEVIPNKEGLKWTPSVVTILRIHHGIFEEISSKGIGKLGGDDMDVLLGKLLADRFQQKTGFDILNSPYKQQFMLAVEQAKIDLSVESAAVARRAALVPERHLNLEEEIDRPTFEREIMPLVLKSGTAIDEAMKLRGLKPKEIDRILLVGGTSKIPLIRRYVAE